MYIYICMYNHLEIGRIWTCQIYSRFGEDYLKCPHSIYSRMTYIDMLRYILWLWMGVLYKTCNCHKETIGTSDQQMRIGLQHKCQGRKNDGCIQAVAGASGLIVCFDQELQTLRIIPRKSQSQLVSTTRFTSELWIHTTIEGQTGSCFQRWDAVEAEGGYKR